jgi:hypothetical protein
VAIVPIVATGRFRGQLPGDAGLHRFRRILTPVYSQAGYSEGGIGKRAGKAGVKWYHPRAFYEGRIDEVKEIDNFIDRLRVEAPKYLAEHWRRHGKDESDEFLRFMIASYRHILLGQTEGRSTPVRVKLP